MKKNYLLYLLFLFNFINTNIYSQYTLVKPGNFLEISGYLSSYYNYRFYATDEPDHHQNSFALDYAVFKLDGNVKKVWNYQLQLNAAALANPSANDGFVMDAYTSYNMLDDAIEVKFGYSKLPFNRNSLLANAESPYLQRPDVDRGSVYTRRDIGTTVRYSFWNKKINFYAGAYTGLGEQSLSGDNDPGGKLEYVGRVDFSYPARYRNQDVDLSHVGIPIIGFGIDGRYTDKNTSIATDPYLLIDGIKTAASANADFLYKGFAAHIEFVRIKMQPNDTTLLFSKPTNYFLGGGLVASTNYYFKKINTVAAIRYDQYNPNDLIPGDTRQTVSFALNYMFDGHRSMLKIQYWKRIKDPDAQKVWTEDQLRLAYQLMF